MDEIRPSLEDAGFIVTATGYGEFSLWKFLSPFQGSRDRAIEDVLRDIVVARSMHDNKRASIISHSFGTYILSKIIERHPEIVWDRIILCGSIVNPRWPIEQYIKRLRPPILNEIGTKDFWPALAERLGWGYGSIGSKGLMHPAVTNRWHHDLAHSDFFTSAFAEKFWVPFLKDGTIVRADKPRPLPLWFRGFTGFLRAAILLIVLVLLAAVAWLLFSVALWIVDTFIHDEPPPKPSQVEVPAPVNRRSEVPAPPVRRCWVIVGSFEIKASAENLAQLLNAQDPSIQARVGNRKEGNLNYPVVVGGKMVEDGPEAHALMERTRQLKHVASSWCDSHPDR